MSKHRHLMRIAIAGGSAALIAVSLSTPSVAETTPQVFAPPGNAPAASDVGRMPGATLRAANSSSSSAVPAARGHIPTPKQYFGFQMGTEGRLAGFSKVLRYFRLIVYGTAKKPLTEPSANIAAGTATLSRVTVTRDNGLVLLRYAPLSIPNPQVSQALTI